MRQDTARRAHGPAIASGPLSRSAATTISPALIWSADSWWPAATWCGPTDHSPKRSKPARSATWTRSWRPATTHWPILHSLTDHRRALYLDRAGEVVEAPDSFMLVCSYNPAYRSSLKELKPSFRQRFATLPMNYLPAEREAEVIVAEAGIELATARRLVQCAIAIRTADEVFHFEPPSTRALVTAAQLIAAGATEMDAAEACILAPLTTDGAIHDGLREVAAASLVAVDASNSKSPSERNPNRGPTGTQTQEGAHRLPAFHLRLLAGDVRHPAVHVVRPRMVGAMIRRRSAALHALALGRQPRGSP